MFSLYLVLILSLLSEGHLQITDALLSVVTEVTEATTVTTSSEIPTSIHNDEAAETTEASANEFIDKTTAVTSTDIPSIPDNETTTSNIEPWSISAISPETNLETAISTYSVTDNEVSLKIENDKRVMTTISSISNCVLAGVMFFKIVKCALPKFSDYFIATLKPMVKHLMLWPMMVAGCMLEFTLGPIIYFLIAVLTPVTFLMRLTLTPLFGHMGRSVNYFLEPTMGFIGTYLNLLLFPLKKFGEFLEYYWIDPVFGPLFSMIEVILDPLAKMLSKLLNRLSPLLELVEPLLEPMLCVTSSLAPILRMFPGSSMVLKVITLLFGRRKVNVSFLTKLLATFDPDMFELE